MAFGEKLTKLRKYSGMSQKALAACGAVTLALRERKRG